MRKSHGRYTNAKSAKRTALFLAVLFLALSAAAYRQFFQENPSFSAEELAVFDLRVRTCSLVEIAAKLNMSESTVDRRIRSIKRKIHKVL